MPIICYVPLVGLSFIRLISNVLALPLNLDCLQSERHGLVGPPLYTAAMTLARSKEDTTHFVILSFVIMKSGNECNACVTIKSKCSSMTQNEVIAWIGFCHNRWPNDIPSFHTMTTAKEMNISVSPI